MSLTCESYEHKSHCQNPGTLTWGLLAEGGDDLEGAAVSSKGFSGVPEGRFSAEGSPIVIRCCGTISGGAFLVSGFCGRVTRLAAGLELFLINSSRMRRSRRL